MRFSLVLFLVTTTGCGPGEKLVDVTVPQNAKAVATTADLPPCDDARRGELFFVEDAEHFVVCRAAGWKEIDLKGPRGATGGPGVAGATGATGPRAPTNTASLVSATIFCTGQLSGTGYYASYSAVVFRSQDVFAEGSIGGAAFDLTSTAFYSASQNGAQTAAVFLTYDIEGTANFGFFRLELNRTTLVNTVRYQDADSPGGERVWTKPASECVTNVYP